MNKKGFTLVELLAVIVILGIVLAIGVVSFNSISSNMKTKQYENIKADIKIAAKKYFADVEKDKVTVETLIKTGYMKGENNEDTLHNPENNADMRCYSVDRNPLEFNDRDERDAEGKCLHDASRESAFLICSDEACDFKINVSNNEWISKNTKDSKGNAIKKIFLGYSVNDIDIVSSAYISSDDDPNNSFEIENDKNTYQIPFEDQNTTYTLTLIFNDGAKKVYKNDVKVDFGLPSCGNITGEEGWSNTSKKITVACSDSASGCVNNKETQTFTKKGINNITITDNAGNSRDCPVTVNIDKEAPSCGTITGEEGWSNTSKEITVVCTDTESGCVNNKETQTFTKKGINNITIADNAGNSRDCPVTVNIDKEAPKCGTKTGEEGWSNTSKKITVACTDTESGCKNVSETRTFTENGNNSITITDNVGNSRDCPVTVNIDKEAPKCGEKSGTNTHWTNKTITVELGCTDSLSGCKQDSYIKSYDNGITRQDTITITDNAENSNTCTIDVYVDKEKPKCGNITGESTTPTMDDRIIDVQCLDSGSGCVKSLYTNTYSTTTEKANIEIKDVAGNTNYCAVNVYVDKEMCKSCMKLNELIDNDYNRTVSGWDVYKTSINSYHYKGSNPDNFIKFDDNSLMWRIVGKYPGSYVGKDSEEEYPKLVTSASYNNQQALQWDSSKDRRTWGTGSLCQFLNGSYYDSLSSQTKSKIANVTWRSNGISSSKKSGDVKVWEKITLNQWQNYSTYTTNDANVGLLSVADYSYASLRKYKENTDEKFTCGVDATTHRYFVGSGSHSYSGGPECANYDYLNLVFWTIDYSTYYGSEGNDEYAWYTYKSSTGKKAVPEADGRRDSHKIYPSIYLSPDTCVKYNENDINNRPGSKDNPYVVINEGC